MDEMLQKLNSHQLEAVYDDHDTTLVNASVGSGKTTVLISKIFYLNRIKQVGLKDMVVLTFTNKAANEIKDRIIEADAGITYEDMPYFGTFHGVAMKLLQTRLPIEKLGYRPGFTILDPDETDEMANGLIVENRLKIKYVNKLQKRIDCFLAGQRLYANMKYDDDIEVLWDLIRLEKVRQNKMDFNDLIRCTTELLTQECYAPKWIIIDEFQDCDRQQTELIRALRTPDTKVFAVGDPNQIIYSWRGSRHQIFSDYKDEYQAKELSLPINYRSTGTILEAARHFLDKQSSLDGIRDQGSRIAVRNHYNAFNEAHYLAGEIKRLQKEGIGCRDIAVFYRMQKQAAVLVDVFEKEGIPYEVSVRKTLKDIPVLQWFVRLIKAAVNPDDAGSAVSVLANPKFGTGLSTVQARKMYGARDGHEDPLLQKIRGFIQWSTSDQSARQIYDYFALDGYLSPTSAAYGENRQFIMNMLDVLQRHMEERKMKLLPAVLDFINTSALYGVEIYAENKTDEKDSVKLMTLHSCKGLEFKYVYIIGVNFGSIPLRTATEAEEEEEKRLFFVGITRAKDNLELSYYTNPDDMRVFSGASSYLGMIPAHLTDLKDQKTGYLDLKAYRHEIKRRIDERGTVLGQAMAVKPMEPLKEEFSKGMNNEIKAEHPKYGIGIIVGETEETITVLFREYGEKEFSKMFNPLVILGG